MVTRYIQSKTPTQVNSNLIGVQVRPNSYRVVNGIYVNYHYEVKKLTEYVAYEDKDGSYRPSDSGLSTVIVRVYDPEDPTAKIYDVYFYDGTSQYDNNGNEYLKILSLPYADSYMWVKDAAVQGDYLYDLDWDETLQAYVATSRNDVFFADVMLNTEVCAISDTQWIDTSGIKYSIFDINNPEFQVIQGNGGFGLVDGTSGTTSEMYFQKTSISKSSGGKRYYYWDGEGSGYPVYDTNKTGVGTLTTWNSVNAGGAVVYRIQNNTYNPMTIKSVDDEIVTDPIECYVDYSVDGETWTTWPDPLTDENNVISNIPRYMYLKFSQDVVITTE